MTSPAPFPKRQFASDNYSGICPEAWESLAAANVGHAPAYGDDAWTQRASDLLRDLFETDCEVFFVFNGTAANSLALSSLCRSYHSILCADVSHVETDECGAPEFFSNGTKLLLLATETGKIIPESIEHMVLRRTDIHYPKPKAVSLTQSTELGTVYTPHEVRAVCEMARQHDLHVHMDGARFANAVAALDVPPKEVTWQAGVDVLCFGGTKNGIPVGEAVIFFNQDLAEEFDYRCKQAGQLASKMRFLAAPWVGLLESGAWLDRARHANAMAKQLSEQLVSVPGVEPLQKTDANAVFVSLSEQVHAALKADDWHYYSFIGNGARFMCSWDTDITDVRALLEASTRS